MHTRICSIAFVVVMGLCVSFSCSKGKESSENSNKNKKYKVVIVTDTVEEFAVGARDGFKETLDGLLKQNNSTAEYTIFDTELKPDKAAVILKEIEKISPDLICMINYPTVFADEQISKKLKDKKYKIVSENCIPIQSGIISNTEKPGGNITGVGVFIQFNSPIRLMKKLNPKAKYLAFYSWDAMTQINEWFEQELKRACKEENIKLVEFRKVPYQEATRQFMIDYSKKGSEYFIMCGISAFVHKDGSAADVPIEDNQWLAKNTNLFSVDYDENTIKSGQLAGTCVIWYDIGAQLADKGVRILSGENPGDISWDYPRKYNIIINQKRAKLLNIKIPQDIMSAAYRIYTDYDGHFVGQDK